jgi:hypothetical protein
MRQVKDKPGSLKQTLVVLMLIRFFLVPPLAGAADLTPWAIAAFDHYMDLTQAKFESQIAQREPFLWIEGLPEARRSAAEAQLREGKVVIERLETLDHGKAIPVPSGMIHHWIGTVFIPGATLEETLAFEEDYEHNQVDFHPDVMRSRILSHQGDDFLVELVFHKKKVITSVLDTDHEIHYVRLDATHAWSRSRTTRIQEVENPGERDERLAPEGHDHGFLWRMDTFWRFEQKDGGTYVECQSISLTRDIPTGLAWMIESFVTSIPRESLTFTLTTTRRAVLQRMASRAATK